MTSRVIPKEQLTAYQRWELLGLDDDQAKQSQRGKSPEEELAVSLPTAQELEEIHRQSAQEGFKLGHEEGYKAGYEMGRKAGEADSKRFAALVQAFEADIQGQNERLSRELLEMALAVAKQMLRTALKVKDGLVLQVLQEAINSLPELSGHLRILVHPDDVEAVTAVLAAEHTHFTAKVIADNRVERGGARIETNHSEVNAELPIRWQEIIDRLGTDNAWLD